MTDMVFDLFGNPERPGKGKRGRPAYEASEKDRNKVKLLLAVGWSNTRIANALAISLATLKRYFRAELAVRDQMQDRLEARRLEKAMEMAETGNVGAMREFGRLLEKQERDGLDRKLRSAQGAGDEDREDEAPAAKRKLGKKEAAQLAAETAGEDSAWGSDLLPGVLN